jgi:protein involved in polysaccharide export with SLBB domain
VVVRHGGTADPGIQLAGGPTTDQAAKQREVVNQLLGVTEANLRKIAGQQLSPSQQDTLTQSRAFVKQSKDAVESGDLDRARTLAWKAELLSEDLLKPQE